MPCSSASTLTPISSVPVMPPLAGVPSSVSQALKLWAQQVLAQIQAAGGATGVNAVPQQYALLAGSALPPIASASNCTVALDATKQLFGAGSYKVSLTGSPAVLTLAADTAWPLQPGWQWMVSFFQQATAAVAGEVTVTTSAGTAYSATFTTTLDSAGWNRLYDALNLIADTSAAFGLSFTFIGGTGQTVWLDGLMLSPFYGRPSVLPSFQNGSAPLLLDNNPDGFYSKILSSRTAGNVAFNFRGAWSSSASYLTGDEVVYGPTYWVALANSTNVQPATGVSAWQAVGSYSEFVGAWSSTATYAVGAEVTYSGSYWVAVVQNSNSAPSTTNANWQIAGSTSASAIVYTDGATVQSLQPAEASADVTATHTSNDTSNVNGVAAATVAQGAGRANAAIDSTNIVVTTGLDLSRAYTNKTLTNIPDGSARFAVVNAAGMNGASAVDAGNNPRIDFSQSFHLNKTADWIPPGSTYAIPRGGAFLNGVPAFNPAGKNLVSNPGFESNVNGTPYNTRLVANDYVGDQWLIAHEDSVFSASLGRATGQEYAGNNNLFIGGPGGGTVLGANLTYACRVYSAVIPVRSGEILYYGAMVFVANAQPIPAGVTLLARVGLAILTTNGAGTETYSPDLTAVTSGYVIHDGTWQAPANVVSVQLELCYFLVIGSTSVTIPAGGTIGNVRFDDAFCFVQVGSDNEIYDGATYARFPVAHFDSLTNRRVSTVNGAVSPLGSIATGATDMSVAYSSTSSSITLSWYGPGGPGTSGTINRMDGSQTTVVAGSITVTGLSASTKYYAAAYYDESAQGIAFVTGQSGAVGSPAILYPSESSAVAWQANLQARVNLGWVPIAAAASGTTGGGNGASGCCLRGPQLIELANGVMREAQELTTGDVLSSPDGPTRITQLRFEPWAEWYRVEFNDGRILEVAPDHRFMDPAGTQIHARDLRLQTIVEARNCYLSVARLELCTDRDIKVGIEVEEPHVYYVDGVLSHNKVYC